MLACAAEQLSAARFAEYLSLGQVPSSGAGAGDDDQLTDEGRDWIPSQDEALLTRVQLVLGEQDWADVKASTFLPNAYGAGYLAGPAEVRLCDRLTCVVFVPADSVAGLRAGDVTFVPKD